MKLIPQPCYLIVILTNKYVDVYRKLYEEAGGEPDVCPIPLSEDGKLPATHWACFTLRDTLELRKIAIIHKKNKHKFGLKPTDDGFFYGFQTQEALTSNLLIWQYSGIQDIVNLKIATLDSQHPSTSLR